MPKIPKRKQSKIIPKKSKDSIQKEEIQCHIHDKVKIKSEIEDINKFVCIPASKENPLIEFGEKYYCLFHLPDKKKNDQLTKFEELFENRLKYIDDEISKIIKSSSNNPTLLVTRIKEKRLNYDFRYVWFPQKVELRGKQFYTNVNFNSATFTEYLGLNSTVFTSSVSFNSTKFEGYTSFISTTFRKQASFTFAEFNETTSFSLAKFLSNAFFSSAKFLSKTSFKSALFTKLISFSSANFLETSKLTFINTKFCFDVDFYETTFDGYVEFEGDIFLPMAQVDRVKIEFQITNIKSNQEAFLRLENAKLNRINGISFSSMKLRMSWFINTEISRLIFNDIKWENIEIDINRYGIEQECNALENHQVSRINDSLSKTCNQLADYAEANHQFEEAQMFRKNALALDSKIKCYVHFAIDANKKDDIRKKVCREYPVVNEDGGNYYCLWHNPDKNKSEIFRREFEKDQARGHSDFRAVTFPITVEYLPFRKNENGRTAKIPSPRKLNFVGATFQRNLIFNNNFEIKTLNLSEAYFEEDADLDFKKAVCKREINLDKAVFDGKFFLKENEEIFFQNPVNALSMKDIRFDKPQNANFYSTRLRPHYFADTDASKFNFHDCRWANKNRVKLVIRFYRVFKFLIWSLKRLFINKDRQEELITLEKRLHKLKKKELTLYDEVGHCKSHKTLAQISNHLAVNYEENRDYEQSSYFRYMAMEARRLEYRNSIWKFFNLYWVYKLTSGYGERWKRALGLLVGLLLAFGILYSTNLSTFDSVDNSQDEIICGKNRIIGNAEGVSVCHGLIHSLAVASFQRPEPKPADWFTKFLVTLETILAPLQAALLALAIRRKFMR